MEPSDLLRHVVGVLERLHLPYFVTGSVAASYFGEPRFTNDIDIVCALPARSVEGFCGAFPEPDFYVSPEAAQEAVAHCGQFNILHPASGLKVDILIPAETPFNNSRFARATRVHPAQDYLAAFASPEDVIIKKMEYYREGGSDKHLRDIAGMLKISGQRVDRAYIADWATRLGMLEIWQSIQQRLEGPAQ
jgi:hypothetical protein